MKDIPEIIREHFAFIVLGVIAFHVVLFSLFFGLFVPLLSWLTYIHWIFGAVLFGFYFPMVLGSLVAFAVNPRLFTRTFQSMGDRFLKSGKLQKFTGLRRYLAIGWIAMMTDPLLLGWSFVAVYTGISILTFSWVSWVFAIHGVVSYEPQGGLWSFVLFYFWYLIDLLPILEVWETLGIKAPIVAKAWTAALPILGFRIYMTLGAFSAVVGVWKVRHVDDLHS